MYVWCPSCKKCLNPDDPYNDLPEKPKGMPQLTYDRLVERYEAYDEKWGREIIMCRFGRRIRSPLKPKQGLR